MELYLHALMVLAQTTSPFYFLRLITNKLYDYTKADL